MIRGVIFDLGGTLITQGDFEEANATALLRWLRGRGYGAGDGLVAALVAERRALWAGRRGTEEVTADRAIGAVLRRIGLPADAALVADAERAFFTAELESSRALPGAVGLLARLNRQGLRTALISNASSHYFVLECCRRLLLAPYLEPIVSSAAVGWVKPDPRVFRVVLRHWALPPGEVVMVGDALAADIAGAQAMRMRSILITATHAPASPTSLGSIRPDAVAKDLPGVGEVIEQWREEP